MERSLLTIVDHHDKTIGAGNAKHQNHRTYSHIRRGASVGRAGAVFKLLVGRLSGRFIVGHALWRHHDYAGDDNDTWDDTRHDDDTGNAAGNSYDTRLRFPRIDTRHDARWCHEPAGNAATAERWTGSARYPADDQSPGIPDAWPSLTGICNLTGSARTPGACGSNQ